MTDSAFDRLSQRSSDSRNLAQPLNFNHVSNGERNIQNLSGTMSAMDNINPNSVASHGFPDLQLCGFETGASQKQTSSAAGRDSNQAVQPSAGSDPGHSAQPPGGSDSNHPVQSPTDAGNQTNRSDSTSPAQDQSWKSHMQDSWVQDELKQHPDYHPMEGLHPGEIAVGNWEPTKEEKKVLSDAFDKMQAEHNDGPVTVRLPDGTICTCEIVRGGHGHGQSFTKGNGDHSQDGKHRKAKLGQPVSDDDDNGQADQTGSDDAPNTTPAKQNAGRDNTNTIVASSTVSDTTTGSTTVGSNCTA